MAPFWRVPYLSEPSPPASAIPLRRGSVFVILAKRKSAEKRLRARPRRASKKPCFAEDDRNARSCALSHHDKRAHLLPPFALVPVAFSNSFTPPSTRSCTPTTQGDCGRPLSASSARYVAGTGPHFVSIFRFFFLVFGVGGGAVGAGNGVDAGVGRRFVQLAPHARAFTVLGNGNETLPLAWVPAKGEFAARRGREEDQKGMGGPDY